MSDQHTLPLRVSPELYAAINRKRGEAFAAGAELSKTDVVLAAVSAALGVEFTPGQRPGAKKKA